MIIGGFQTAGGNWFDGLIDDVRIYNRALTAQEIRRLYNLGSTFKINSQTARNDSQLTNGLVGYWSFDDNDMGTTSALDVSGNSNLGHLINGPKKTIGRLGQALDFDGSDDYVDMGDQATLEGMAELTLSAWVKPDVLSGTQFIVAKHLDNFGSYYLAFPSATLLRFYIRNSSGEKNSHDATFSEGAGVWTHVAGVYNGSDMRLFINGTETPDAPTSKTGTLADTGDTVRIGTNTTGGGEFDGQIDDVRIYNRALSASEIQRLYQMGR